jgi:hypothetical protein
MGICGEILPNWTGAANTKFTTNHQWLALGKDGLIPKFMVQCKIALAKNGALHI